ncbi:hypothetical protein [Streptomyces sp. IBSBF 3136]|uniref:hypothetical protein n=1 Tax=Streptomyces sp. IBSBF 3136 TaxID=2903524 RepID=UPI002FDC00AA
MSFAVRAVVQVGYAVPGVRLGGRGQDGGREQELGERVRGADRGGPDGALLRYAGRFYAVRHAG